MSVHCSFRKTPINRRGTDVPRSKFDQVPELLDAVRSLRCFDVRFGKNDAVAVPREIDPVPADSDDLTKAS